MHEAGWTLAGLQGLPRWDVGWGSKNCSSFSNPGNAAPVCQETSRQFYFSQPNDVPPGCRCLCDPASAFVCIQTRPPESNVRDFLTISRIFPLVSLIGRTVFFLAVNVLSIFGIAERQFRRPLICPGNLPTSRGGCSFYRHAWPGCAHRLSPLRGLTLAPMVRHRDPPTSPGQVPLAAERSH